MGEFSNPAVAGPAIAASILIIFLGATITISVRLILKRFDAIDKKFDALNGHLAKKVDRDDCVQMRQDCQQVQKIDSKQTKERMHNIEESLDKIAPRPSILKNPKGKL